MKKLKTITILTLSILLFSFTINAEEKKEVATTPYKDVEIAVLKEQIKALEEKINNQQKELQKELTLRSELNEKLFNTKNESIEKRMSVYITGISSAFIIVISLLSFFGYKMITSTVKEIVVPQVKEVIKKLEKELKQEGIDSLNNVIAKLEVDESLKSLSARTSEKVRGTGISKTVPAIPEKTREDLAEFGDLLAQTKTEKQYSFDDWFYKGLSEYDKENYPAAITYWSEALKLNSKSALAYYNRGLAYNNLKQHERAIEDCNKAIEFAPSAAIAYNNRGLIYDNLKQHERAIEDYNKAIEFAPKDAITYNNRGIAYGNLKQYERAMKDYNKAIELDPGYAPAYNNRGVVYGELEQYERAMKDYNKAIELDPGYAPAYNNRGLIYDSLKQHERAIEDHNKAIGLIPGYAIAYNNRGIAYGNLKQYERAIKDCNKAIELDPGYAVAYNNRGIAYGNLKQYKRAIEDYNKSIELDTKNIEFYINLFESNIIIGDYKGASKGVAQALSLLPEIKDKAMLLYFGCITKKLLGMDTSVFEKDFTEILKNDFIIMFNFDMFESWLKDADIDEDTKTFIKGKTELLKKHLKKI